MSEAKTQLKQPKIFDTIDAKVEGKPGLKTVWQFGKFIVASIVASLIQVVLQLVLPLIFDHFQTALPGFLSWIINPATLEGEDAIKYVVKTAAGASVVTWGYLLPFFISNYAANIFTYVFNKKYTFKSKAPKWHFVLYFILMTLVIVFSTWLQGVCYAWLSAKGVAESLARLLVIIPAAAVQFVAFFIIQKILLPEDPELAAAAAEDDDAEAVAKDIVADIDDKAEAAAEKVSDEVVFSSPKGREPADGDAPHDTI